MLRRKLWAAAAAVQAALAAEYHGEDDDESAGHAGRQHDGGDDRRYACSPAAANADYRDAAAATDHGAVAVAEMHLRNRKNTI